MTSAADYVSYELLKADACCLPPRLSDEGESTPTRETDSVNGQVSRPLGPEDVRPRPRLQLLQILWLQPPLIRGFDIDPKVLRIGHANDDR